MFNPRIESGRTVRHVRNPTLRPVYWRRRSEKVKNKVWDTLSNIENNIKRTFFLHFLYRNLYESFESLRNIKLKIVMKKVNFRNVENTHFFTINIFIFFIQHSIVIYLNRKHDKQQRKFRYNNFFHDSRIALFFIINIYFVSSIVSKFNVWKRWIYLCFKFYQFFLHKCKNSKFLIIIFFKWEIQAISRLKISRFIIFDDHVDMHIISLFVELGFEQKFKSDSRIDVRSNWIDQSSQFDSRIDVRRVLSSLFETSYI